MDVAAFVFGLALTAGVVAWLFSAYRRGAARVEHVLRLAEADRRPPAGSWPLHLRDGTTDEPTHRMAKPLPLPPAAAPPRGVTSPNSRRWDTATRTRTPSPGRTGR